MRLGIIILARSNSSRLPRKILMKVKNSNLIDYVISIAKKVKFVDKIIVSTTTKKSDDDLIKHLKKKKINFFRGDLKNVSYRFLKTIDKYKFDTILRLNGDSPLHSPSLINHSLKIFKKKNIDICTNVLKRSFPRGMSIEIMTSKAYKKAYKLINTEHDKENVTSVIYKNKKKFKIYNLKNEINQKKINLSVDTKKDFLFFNKIILKYGRLNLKYSYKKYLKKVKIFNQSLDKEVAL